MKKRRDIQVQKQRQLLMILGIGILIIALVVGIVFWRKSVKEREKIQEGIAYLKSLEDKDAAEINTEVKKIKKEQNKEYMDKNDEAIWTGFEDAVIMGDSRAVGFSYYDFMSAEQVFAEKGALITSVKEKVEAVKAVNPGQIYICFGLNDLQSGQWPTASSYSEQCAEIIELLKDALPQCDVYLNSILPVTEATKSADPIYSSITEYNDSMKKMCEEKGYNFIDNTKMAQEHMDLYETDGLHLQSGFYTYWATNMLLEGKEE